MRYKKICSCRCSLFRVVAIIVLLVFVFLSAIPPGHAQVLSLPPAGTVVPLSPAFQPVVLRGIQVDPFKHLEMSFIVDAGDSGLRGRLLEQETKHLVHYFLASLAIPEDDLWVNLSPYEDDRIIPYNLGQTEMGRDLLAQDYLLKQVTASLLHPDDQVGREFWRRVYKRAYEEYGTTNVPVNTFNKVWILPDTAHVYEEHDRAIIIDARMKVMLEEDYLSKETNLQDQVQGQQGQVAQLSSEIMRRIVIPEIEKEVNEGRNFARVRQIYYSLVLAHWFKTKLRGVLLNKIFSDMSKVEGFKVDDPQVVEAIYDQYVESFKKGVCDLLRIDYDANEKKHVARKYFSGGATMQLGEENIKPATSGSAIRVLKNVASTGALFLLGFMLNLVVSATEAHSGTTHNDLFRNPEIELATDINLDAPPNIDPDNTDPRSNQPGATHVQMFGQTIPAVDNGTIIQAANNPDANLVIKNIHQTTVHNSRTGQDVPVNVFEAEITVNGIKYAAFGSELQVPNPGFNFGHMTASHVYQALIKSFKADPTMAKGVTQAMGMTDEVSALTELEKQYRSVIIGGPINASDPAFINTNNPFTMAIGAIYFAVSSDGRRIPTLIDPLPIRFPELIPQWDLKLPLGTDIELVHITREGRVFVQVDGRTMSTVHGKEGRNLAGIIPTIENFVRNLDGRNVGDYQQKGINSLLNMGFIDQASQFSAKDLAPNGGLHNIINLIAPDFLERIDYHAKQVTSNLQDGYNNLQADISKEDLALAYLGFIADLANNSYVKSSVNDLFDQIANNISMQTQDGSVSAQTSAQIGDIITQVANSRFEVSFKGEDGKTKKVNLSLSEVASFRYAMDAGLGVNAQGSIVLDGDTQTILVEILEQFQGSNFQDLVNTDYYDLGGSYLGSLLNNLFESPSQVDLDAGIAINGFAQGLVSGLKTFSAQAGVEVEVKGVPVVINAFGGAGAYAVVRSDISVNTQGLTNIVINQQGSDLSGQGSLIAGGQVGGSVSGQTQAAVHGGIEVTIPQSGLSVLVNIGEVSSQDISAYGNVDGSMGVKVKDEKLNLSLNFTSEFGAKGVTKNHVSYNAGEIDLNDLLSSLPNLDKMNEWARGQGEGYLNVSHPFLLYLQNNLDVASAWNNFMPGSENFIDGLNNFIEGLDTHYGLINIFEKVRQAMVDSGNLALWQEFEAKISGRLNEIQEDLRQQLSENREEFARDLITKMQTSHVTVLAIKEFNLLETKYFSANGHLDLSIGSPGAGLRAVTSFQNRFGHWSTNASVEFGVTMQTYFRIKNLGIGMNITPGDFSRMMRKIDLIQATTLKKMTSFDVVEDVRKVVDQTLFDMDTISRVKVMGLMLFNPQIRDLYNLNIDPDDLTGFAMVKAVYQNRQGTLAGSLSFETMMSRLQGTRRYQSYVELAAKMKLDQTETNQFLSLALAVDPAFGIVGGGVSFEANKVDFDMKFNRVPQGVQGHVFQVGIRGDLKEIINIFQRDGKVRVNHNNLGAEVHILDRKGNTVAIDYVPYDASQAEEINDLLLMSEDKAVNDEVANNEAANRVIDILLEQAIEAAESESQGEQEVVPASKETKELKDPSASSNVGGIAFDSRTINMTIEGEGLEFEFPDHLITDQMRNLMGLIPQIINFTPVTNPAILIGPLSRGER